MIQCSGHPRRKGRESAVSYFGRWLCDARLRQAEPLKPQRATSFFMLVASVLGFLSSRYFFAISPKRVGNGSIRGQLRRYPWQMTFSQNDQTACTSRDSLVDTWLRRHELAFVILFQGAYSNIAHSLSGHLARPCRIKTHRDGFTRARESVFGTSPYTFSLRMGSGFRGERNV